MSEKIVMTSEKRMEIISAFLENVCFPILDRKGKASAGGGVDVNQAFYDAGEPDCGVDAHVVWWVYFYKQIARFKAFVFTKKDVGETCSEMLADIVNYALIMVSMLVAEGKMDFKGNPYTEKQVLYPDEFNDPQYNPPNTQYDAPEKNPNDQIPMPPGSDEENS